MAERGTHSGRLLGAVLGVLLVAAAACSSTEDGGSATPSDEGAGDETTATDDWPESPDPRFVVDRQGRVLLLRGINNNSTAKGDADHVGWPGQADVARLADDFGFDVARHLIFWEGVEPRPGEYDQAYLDRVEERLDWYEAAGMYVVIDMHQDLYARAFGGDGAPEWATITDGVEFEPTEGPWWLNAVNPAVENAFANFWDPGRGHPELQDHYFAAWQEVARRFADHPAVIGYDVMNEPTWSMGGLGESLAFRNQAVESGDWTNDMLTDFSQRAIDAIRSVDADHWVFVEPTSLVNTNIGGTIGGPFPGDIGDLTDPRDGAPRLGYAPHLYEVAVHEGGPYPPGNTYVPDWEELRSTDREALGGVLWLGEWGAGPPTPPADLERYIGDVLDMADRQLIGWAWWSYDPGGWGITDSDGRETDHAGFLVRPFPRATAGTPTALDYDRERRVLRFSFESRAGVEGPTEISLPADRLYPDGWELVVTGGDDDSWSSAWDADREVLDLTTDPSVDRYAVCIAPTTADCD